MSPAPPSDPEDSPMFEMTLNIIAIAWAYWYGRYRRDRYARDVFFGRIVLFDRRTCPVCGVTIPARRSISKHTNSSTPWCAAESKPSSDRTAADSAGGRPTRVASADARMIDASTPRRQPGNSPPTRDQPRRAQLTEPTIVGVRQVQHPLQGFHQPIPACCAPAAWSPAETR